MIGFRGLLAVVAIVGLGGAGVPDPCALLNTDEASLLLGAPAGTPKAEPNGCGVSAGDDHLSWHVATVPADDAPRLLKHLDEARGDEIPTMHGEPWYEVSLPDGPDREMIVWRDRTSLTVDLHSARQPDAKSVFGQVWHEIALRLPADQ